VTRVAPRAVVAAVVVATLLAGGAFLAGRLTSGAVSSPTTDSAAAGFLRDMQVHHAQAVLMSLTIRDRTDDEAVRLLAYDIATAQAGQAGQMYGLLNAWDLPQAGPGRAMDWTRLPTIDGSDGGHSMDDSVSAADMPGMATPAQLADLDAAEGDDAVRLFLTLMIAHHEGGVEMAEAVLARSDVPQIVSLAGGIERSQLAEITLMQDMLADLPAAGD
jgi:uncharacterized protein (DUF305 family)